MSFYMRIQKTTLIRQAFFIGVLFLISAQGFAAEKGEQMKNSPIKIKIGESFLLQKDQAAKYKGILFNFSAVTHPFSKNPDTGIEQYPKEDYELTVSYRGTKLNTYKIGDGTFLRLADPSDQVIGKIEGISYAFRRLEHKLGEVRLILNKTEYEVAPIAKQDAAKQSLIYSIKLRYDIEKDVARKVIYLDETFHNSGQTPLTLSLWGQSPMVKAVKPWWAFRKEKTRAACGMPGAAKESDVLQIPPNQSITVSQWYWAQSLLPWTSEPDKGFNTLFHLKKSSSIQIALCRVFRNDVEVVGHLLKCKVQLVEGKFCSAPVKFKYEILEKEEK